MSTTSEVKGMRIIRVYRRLPPATGGMELHIARLSKAQRNLGIEVLNIHNVGLADGSAIRVWPSVDLDSIRPQSLRNFLFYAGAVWRAKSLPRNIPTILHVHGAWSDFLLSKVLAGAIGAQATFASIHSVARPRLRWLYRLALSHCAEVLVTGKADQKFLAEAIGRDVVHLPSGVASEFAEAPDGYQVPNQFDVISVGNFLTRKRLDIVVECARFRPQLRFAIVGDGPTRPVIEAMIAESRIRNVSLLGRQPARAVASLLRGSKLFLSTSEEEGAPTAALEAMAVGLPVVLAPSNDFTWLVNPGVNGIITKDWTVAEFVDAIDTILKDEARRVAMGARNRESLKDHIWPNIAERLTRLMAARINVRHSA